MKKMLIVGLVLGFIFALTQIIVALLNANSDLAPAVAYLLILLAMSVGIWAIAKLINRNKAKVAKILSFLSLLILTGCYKVVSPGTVGIVVKQTGQDRGVQDIPLQTGRVFYNPLNEYVLEYPTYVQRAIWTSSNTEGRTGNDEISFQSSDSLHFTGDVAVGYQLVRERVPHFYVQFRTDDLESFTHGFFRDAVRKSIGIAATHYTAEEINGGKQAALESEATDALKAAMNPYGVDIRQLAFTSPPRPPDQVRQAIQGKIAAIQDAERVENQKRQSIAEGEKMKAIAAATAASNALVNSSITPQLIQWRTLDILGGKWDGRLPQVQSGSSGLLLNVPQPK